jgi:hypothetical protein
MPLEDMSGYLDGLDPNNPNADDFKEEGDDHIRGIKNVLLNTFGGVNGQLPDDEQIWGLTRGPGDPSAWWAAAAKPATVSSSAPTSGDGLDGDIWYQLEA